MCCRVGTRLSSGDRGAAAATAPPKAPGDARTIEARTGIAARDPRVETAMSPPEADRVGDRQEGIEMRVLAATTLVALAAAATLSGCATSEEWAEWKSHSTHFASDRHMGFSVRNNKDGSNLRVTRADMDTAPRENWWGKVLTVSPNQIFQD